MKKRIQRVNKQRANIQTTINLTHKLMNIQKQTGLPNDIYLILLYHSFDSFDSYTLNLE